MGIVCDPVGAASIHDVYFHRLELHRRGRNLQWSQGLSPVHGASVCFQLSVPPAVAETVHDSQGQVSA